MFVKKGEEMKTMEKREQDKVVHAVMQHIGRRNLEKCSNMPDCFTELFKDVCKTQYQQDHKGLWEKYCRALSID